ncbi:MAG: hypothetical protein R6U28_06445 [Cyclonatronaceae bacterium]
MENTRAVNKVFERWVALMDAREYRSASVEAERIFFHSGERSNRMQALLARSWALKHLGEYDQAFENLRRASPRALPAQLQYRIHHERTLLMYLREDWEGVLAESTRLNHMVQNPDWRLLSGYLPVLALLELERWEEAEAEMHAYLGKLGLSGSLPASPPDRLNPRKAALLSTFLPGSGQMYAGKAGEGLGSLGLQLAALGWGAYNVYTGYYATALFTGGGLFQAFYFGGIQRAEYHAVEHNKIKSGKYIREIAAWFLELVEPSLMQKRQTLPDLPFLH